MTHYDAFMNNFFFEILGILNIDQRQIGSSYEDLSILIRFLFMVWYDTHKIPL